MLLLVQIPFLVDNTANSGVGVTKGVVRMIAYEKAVAVNIGVLGGPIIWKFLFFTTSTLYHFDTNKIR